VPAILTTILKHHIDKRAGQLVEDFATKGEPDDLLNTEAVAQWLGVSVPWLQVGRSSGRYGPPFVRCSPRHVRYRRTDVLAWLKERTHASTQEYDTSFVAGPGRPRKEA